MGDELACNHTFIHQTQIDRVHIIQDRQDIVAIENPRQSTDIIKKQF